MTISFTTSSCKESLSTQSNGSKSNGNSDSLYQRIACLSTESVEVLYALGAEDLIAGISGYTTRPSRARTEKPKSVVFFCQIRAYFGGAARFSCFLLEYAIRTE